MTRTCTNIVFNNGHQQYSAKHTLFSYDYYTESEYFSGSFRIMPFMPSTYYIILHIYIRECVCVLNRTSSSI